MRLVRLSSPSTSVPPVDSEMLVTSFMYGMGSTRMLISPGGRLSLLAPASSAWAVTSTVSSPGMISASSMVRKYIPSPVLTRVPAGIVTAPGRSAARVNRSTTVAWPAGSRPIPTSGARLSNAAPVLVGRSSALPQASVYSIW